MIGSQAWARSDGRPSTVFVYEYITGGGLAGQDLPESLAREGSAMRRALIHDFASVPGVRVVTTLDARLSLDAPTGVVVRLLSLEGNEAFAELASEADFTLVVAPETGGILVRLAEILEGLGVRSLGSSPKSIALTGDKWRSYQHLMAHQIPTPPTRIVTPREIGPILDGDGLSVVKPVEGAGSVDTFLVGRIEDLPAAVFRHEHVLIQPYAEGVPMSASVLVDVEGNPTCLAVGRQTIEVESGAIHYRGGEILSFPVDFPEVTRAVMSVPGLRGFVGVDFIQTREHAIILEINPRPTTSIVGLAQQWPPGTMAGAWLEAATSQLDSPEWPDLIRSTRSARGVFFHSDGSIF